MDKFSWERKQKEEKMAIIIPPGERCYSPQCQYVPYADGDEEDTHGCYHLGWNYLGNCQLNSPRKEEPPRVTKCHECGVETSYEDFEDPQWVLCEECSRELIKGLEVELTKVQEEKAATDLAYQRSETL